MKLELELTKQQVSRLIHRLSAARMYSNDGNLNELWAEIAELVMDERERLTGHRDYQPGSRA